MSGNPSSPPSTTTSVALVTARRTPLQLAAYASLALAGLVGVLRCASDARIPALAALVGALALLFPAVRENRAFLPAALVAGSIPAVIATRAHGYPAYELIVVGLLLVACAECTARSWYVHSQAPRPDGVAWPASLAVLLGCGAMAAAGVMAAARVRLDGAVVLTFVGAAALAAAGLLAARASR